MGDPTIRSAPALAALACAALMTGCMSFRETNTVRTPEEQMLLSKSVDYTFDAMTFSKLSGRLVFVDATNLDCTDKAYVVDALKQRLGMAGAKIVEKSGEASAVVTVRSAMLSTQSGSALIGIPSIKVPLPIGGSTLETPEVALFKRAMQEGWCKLHVTAYDGDTRALLDKQEGAARTHFDRWHILFLVHFKRTNVPELQMSATGEH